MNNQLALFEDVILVLAESKDPKQYIKNWEKKMNFLVSMSTNCTYP